MVHLYNGRDARHGGVGGARVGGWMFKRMWWSGLNAKFAAIARELNLPPYLKKKKWKRSRHENQPEACSQDG